MIGWRVAGLIVLVTVRYLANQVMKLVRSKTKGGGMKRSLTVGAGEIVSSVVETVWATGVSVYAALLLT